MKLYLYLILTVCTCFSLSAAPIKLGLAIEEELCEKLASDLNRSLPQYKFEVISIVDYDARMVAVVSNTFDLLEGGYRMFHEFKKRRPDAEVILHANYYNSFDNELSAAGYIITKNPDMVLSDINLDTAIFAVHAISSPGSFLQKVMLKEKGIKYSDKNIQYIQSIKNVLNALSKDKLSVGFVPSYSDLDGEAVRILGESDEYPGGMVFTDSRNVSDELKFVLQKKLHAFYNSISWVDRSSARNMIVPDSKFHDDFNDLELFSKQEKALREYTVVRIWFALGGSVLFILLLVIYRGYRENRELKYTLKSKDADNLDDILQKLNIHEEFSRVSELLTLQKLSLDEKDTTPLLELLDRTEALIGVIDSNDSEHFRDTINNLCRKSEKVLTRLTLSLNKSKLPTHELLGGREIQLGSTYMYKVEQFKAFCDKADKNHARLDPEVFTKLNQTIFLPAPFLLLATMRNQVSHENNFKPTKEHLLLAAFASICIMRHILDSEVLRCSQ